MIQLTKSPVQICIKTLAGKKRSLLRLHTGTLKQAAEVQTDINVYLKSTEWYLITLFFSV